MSAAWVIKAIDIFEDSQFSSTACVPSISPYQFMGSGHSEIPQHTHSASVSVPVSVFVSVPVSVPVSVS